MITSSVNKMLAYWLIDVIIVGLVESINMDPIFTTITTDEDT